MNERENYSPPSACSYIEARLLLGQVAQAESNFSIEPWQEPQSVPAWQCSPTASTESAPDAMAARI